LETQVLTTSIEDATTRAKRKWEEVWGNPIESKRNWQRMAFIEGIAILGALWMIWHLHQAPTQLLYVLETDKAHEHVQYAGLYQPTNMDAATWDAVKIQGLTRFIEAWRTVTTDKDAQEHDWDRAFMYLGENSQAKAAIANWYAQNDPIRRAQDDQIVSVQYKTFDVEGKNTYGIWWAETTMSSTGQTTSTKMYRARIVYDIHLPTSEAARQENKLGILITEISFEEVQ